MSYPNRHYKGEVTAVAWSTSQLICTMAREGVLHLQGFERCEAGYRQKELPAHGCG